MINLNARSTALLPNLAFMIVAITLGFGLSNSASHAQSGALHAPSTTITAFMGR